MEVSGITTNCISLLIIPIKFPFLYSCIANETTKLPTNLALQDTWPVTGSMKNGEDALEYIAVSFKYS